MKKQILYFLTTLQCFSFFIAGIIFVVKICSFNFSFYKNYYTENDFASTLNLSDDKLLSYVTNLLDYIQNKNNTLDSSWFSKKDILHMVDVKNLYLTANLILTTLTILIIALFIILAIIFKREYFICLNFLFSKIIVLAFLLLFFLSVIASIDFNFFWISFHKIFFSNDLWLLSPSESNLIKMFPEDFFFLLVKKIIIYIVSFFALALTINNTLISYLLHKKITFLNLKNN